MKLPAVLSALTLSISAAAADNSMSTKAMNHLSMMLLASRHCGVEMDVEKVRFYGTIYMRAHNLDFDMAALQPFVVSEAVALLDKINSQNQSLAAWTDFCEAMGGAYNGVR